MTDRDEPIIVNMNVTNLAPNATTRSQVTDIVFNEFYQEKMQGMIAVAHMQGQAMGIQTMLTLMQEFEEQGCNITVDGMNEYLTELNYNPERIGG